jgi:hypothetical protein
MSSEVRELKDHIRSLEDRLDWFGQIEDEIAEVKNNVSWVQERLDDFTARSTIMPTRSGLCATHRSNRVTS